MLPSVPIQPSRRSVQDPNIRISIVQHRKNAEIVAKITHTMEAVPAALHMAPAADPVASQIIGRHVAEQIQQIDFAWTQRDRVKHVLRSTVSRLRNVRHEVPVVVAASRTSSSTNLITVPRHPNLPTMMLPICFQLEQLPRNSHERSSLYAVIAFLC